MNSRERVLKIIKGEIPDRVPLFELVVDNRIINKIKPNSDYLDFAEDNLDLVLTGSPSTLYKNEYIDKQKKIFINEWKIVRQESGQTVSIPIEGPIKIKEDLKNFKVPDPNDEYRYLQLSSLINKFKGIKAIGMHLHDVFNYPFYLRGMENFLIDMVTDENIVKKLVDISLEHNIVIAKNALKMGADFIVLGDDYGTSFGPIFSPKSFEKLLWPGLKEIVQEIKRNGGFVIKHCCGDINSLLDMIIESGIDALHPFDQTSNMDIAHAQKKYKKLVVMGGVDCGKLLVDGTIDDVVNVVKELLKNVSSNGRHIISSSNTIHPGVNPENYMAMIETTKKFGIYPIKI
jgi:uroporphyrinogen decarboxylase